MDTNLLRKLALMQHEGDDFFTLDIDGLGDYRAYEGTEEDAREQWKNETEQEEESEADEDQEQEKDEQEIQSFEDWAQENLTEIEPAEDEGTDRYLILTDDEADEKWDESLQNYIDECILPEIPESYRTYFDEEKWKDDAKHDGRGHSLASYDGHENSEIVEGETFYIFKIG